MAESTVLGMPLTISDSIAQPLAAVVMVKGLDEDGEVVYWIGKTEGLTRVEAVGMFIVSGDEFRASLAGLPRLEDQ